MVRRLFHGRHNWIRLNHLKGVMVWIYQVYYRKGCLILSSINSGIFLRPLRCCLCKQTEINFIMTRNKPITMMSLFQIIIHLVINGVPFAWAPSSLESGRQKMTRHWPHLPCICFNYEKKDCAIHKKKVDKQKNKNVIRNRRRKRMK